MNKLVKLISGVGRTIVPGAFITAFYLLTAHPAAATLSPGLTTFILRDDNSSVTLLPGGSGMTEWTVDGQNQLYDQSFYYRVGNTGFERSIGTLPIVSQVQPSASTLNVLYSNGQFSIETTYFLLGGTPGSGTSDVGEQIKIKNLTASPLDFHFFQYADFDLGGTPCGDQVQFGRNASGLFNEAFQQKGNVHISDTVIAPGASHAEVTRPFTLADRLTDCSPTTLNDTAGPLFGDVAWAFQWDKQIAAGGSFIISIDKNIYINPVPEPTVTGLLPLGLLAMGLARRFFR